MNIFALMVALSVLSAGACGKPSSGTNPYDKEPVEEEGNKNYGEDPYQYPRKDNDVIRLMTYNSFYCKGNSSDAMKNGFSERNTANFAKVVAALNPDMIAIQELDRNVAERDRRDLLNDIAKATGKQWNVVFAPAASYGGGQIGPGLLVKKSLPMPKIKTVAIPGNEPRMLIIAEFDDMVFIATHLDTDDSKRASSADQIVYWSNLFSGSKPVFLAGDLNDSPHWAGGGAAFPVLKKEFVIKSSTESTLPGQSNTIDYILYDANGTDFFDFVGTHVVKKFKFDQTLESLDTVSDHYPVILDIERHKK